MTLTSLKSELDALNKRIAPIFHRWPYAWMAVLEHNEWRLGIAVLGERGYTPVQSPLYWDDFDTVDDIADGINETMGLDRRQVMHIVGSTMTPIGGNIDARSSAEG